MVQKLGGGLGAKGTEHRHHSETPKASKRERNGEGFLNSLRCECQRSHLVALSSLSSHVNTKYNSLLPFPNPALDLGIEKRLQPAVLQAPKHVVTQPSRLPNDLLCTMNAHNAACDKN